MPHPLFCCTVLLALAVTACGGRAALQPTVDGGPTGLSDAGADDAGLPTGVGSDAGQVSVADYGSNDARYDALYTAAMAGRTEAKWVSVDGDDGAAGTSAAPYATLKKALASIGPGGTVIVKDGTYPIGPNGFLNDYRPGNAIPSGTASTFTLVRAENRFGARLVQDAADYYGSVVRLEKATRVWVDGFVVEKRSDAEYPIVLGNGNRLTRTIIVQRTVEQFGGAVFFGSNNVIEDVAAYGWARYAFNGGSGGANTPAGNTVLRRVISFLAGGPSRQPSASYAFYGSNNSAYGEVKNVLFANCYEIDSPAFGSQDPDARKWGAWYHPKSVRNVLHHGCGVINSGATYGAFRTDNFGGPTAQMAQYQDSFVAGFIGDSGPASGFSMSEENGVNTALQVSVCKTPGGAVSGGVSESKTAVNPPHPVQRAGQNGAEQRYAVGKFLSAFGEAEFTVPQVDMPLWPYPYEEAIAREFAVSLPKPGGFLPEAVAATGNPFAGNSLDGSPMTFTRRVWEACGTPTPSFRSIYR
jgi:hypothetical protein